MKLTIKEKITILRKLYKKITPIESKYFMCNALSDIHDDERDRWSIDEILTELWKDRDKTKAIHRSGYEVRNNKKFPYVWYEMKKEKEDVKIRKQNITRTINRLKQLL